MSEAIEITLYDENSEPINTYTQSVITFDMLLKASQLEELIADTPQDEKKWWWQFWKREKTDVERQINMLMQFVSDFFGNQFSAKQLRAGAEVTEVMTVVQSIMGRANQIVELNPTAPQPRRQK